MEQKIIFFFFHNKFQSHCMYWEDGLVVGTHLKKMYDIIAKRFHDCVSFLIALKTLTRKNNNSIACWKICRKYDYFRGESSNWKAGHDLKIYIWCTPVNSKYFDLK